MEPRVSKGVYSFFLAYIVILILGTLIISIDGFTLETNFTATLSCLSNIGPGFGSVGPFSSFSIYSNFSKAFLSLVMLAGRLEIFPILILFSPITWKK